MRFDFPLGGLDCTGKQREQSRLAGAVRTDERDRLACEKLDVSRRERLDLAVTARHSE
jgi:hypothetical protein